MLDIATGTEQFTSFGATEPETVEPGEVIYHDNTDVLCRRWNWREAAKTAMKESTKNVCLILEVLDASEYATLDVALEELAAEVTKHCGGTAAIHRVDASSPHCQL